jgi:UDP:flavonoid glycosyltransferase YjiC (YdhE family)
MGIPLILVPFTGDQLGNSEAAESLGVGYYFRHDEGTSLNAHTDPWRSSLTPETMKQAIEFALSESTKQKATELANEYHRHTPELVVDNILAWLKSQQEGK